MTPITEHKPAGHISYYQAGVRDPGYEMLTYVSWTDPQGILD